MKLAREQWEAVQLVPERECVVCGVLFRPSVGSGRTKLTCSTVCRKQRNNDLVARYRAKRALSPPVIRQSGPKICAVCGTEFHHIDARRINCSTACSEKYIRRRLREHIVIRRAAFKMARDIGLIDPPIANRKTKTNYKAKPCRCTVCNVEFQPTGSEKTCSPVCLVTARRRYSQLLNDALPALRLMGIDINKEVPS